MTWNMQRRQQIACQCRPVSYQGFHQPPVAGSVFVQTGSGLNHIAVEKYGCSVGERVGELNIRIDPFQTILIKWKGSHERRGHPEGMHCRADIMQVTGQGQRLCAGSAPDGIGPFKKSDCQPGTCQGYGSG